MNILIMFKNNLIKLKSALITAICGAIGLIVIFNSVNGLGEDFEESISKIHVGYIDYDNNKLSESLKTYLTEKQNMVLIEKDFDNLSDLLLDRKISVIIEVPENFHHNAVSGNLQNLIVTSLDDYQNAEFTKVYINTFMQGAEIISKSANNDEVLFNKLLDGSKEFDTKITTDTSLIKQEEKSSAFQFEFASGFYLMLVYSVCLIFSLSIADDRISGTYSRIKSAPIKPIHYIIGTALYGLFTLVVFYGGFLGYLAIIGVNFGMPMWLAIVSFTIFSLFALGVSILLSLLDVSKNTIATFIIGFATITNILGGAYFPIEDSVGDLKKISMITPNYWFMEIVRNGTGGADFNIISALSILTLYTVLVYLISAVIFARKK